MQIEEKSLVSILNQLNLYDLTCFLDTLTGRFFLGQDMKLMKQKKLMYNGLNEVSRAIKRNVGLVVFCVREEFKSNFLLVHIQQLCYFRGIQMIPLPHNTLELLSSVNFRFSFVFAITDNEENARIISVLRSLCPYSQTVVSDELKNLKTIIAPNKRR